MAQITDITPELVNADRMDLLDKINQLPDSRELDQFSSIDHSHNIEELYDLFDGMSNFADTGHTHRIEEFPVLDKIAKSLAVAKHIHDRNSTQILLYEIEQTQNKINSLQEAISKSIAIINQMGRK